MGVESAEQIVKHAFDRFVRVAMALMRWRERDADFHLARVALLAVEPAIADEIAGSRAHNRQLKPRSGNIWFRG